MKALLSDNLIALRPLEPADLQGGYRDWFNDPDVVRFNSHGRFPMTVEQLSAYVAESSASPNRVVLAIIVKATGLHVGNISLQNLNWVDRSAEIAFVLGDSAHRGKGIMFRAGTLLIAHGFGALNLHRIGCGTLSTNVAMQRLALKLGMQQEGVRREAVFKEGRYLDVIEYGILAGER